MVLLVPVLELALGLGLEPELVLQPVLASALVQVLERLVLQLELGLLARLAQVLL